jgi:hypothetical protein
VVKKEVRFPGGIFKLPGLTIVTLKVTNRNLLRLQKINGLVNNQ